MKTICQKICNVDEDNTFCIGCGRTLDEIREWYYADTPRKKEIMLSAKERLLIESVEVLDVDYHLREYD
ncbi:MAG: hypothetical protein [Caudoviricetes sp.]|nr:MAG: hypothetical protein [Caudoviricetes sp.]